MPTGSSPIASNRSLVPACATVLAISPYKIADAWLGHTEKGGGIGLCEAATGDKFPQMRHHI